MIDARSGVVVGTCPLDLASTATPLWSRSGEA